MATGDGLAVPKWARRNFDRPDEDSRTARDLSVDKIMVTLVVALLLFGLVMVYSASAVLAEKHHGTQFYFLIRQAIWGLIGLLLMTAAIKIDYRHYRRPAVVISLLGLSLTLLLIAFLLPTLNGTHRWIRYGAASIQPSEIAKVALIAFLAFFLERNIDKTNDFLRSVLPIALIAAFTMGLVAAEPDLGTALAIGLVFVVVTFVAGVKLRFLAMLAVPVLPVLAYMLIFVPWRHQRLLAFLDPWKNQATSGFQTVQALVAIGSGGPAGVGLAQGKQKLFYLPSPHTDFIFAVVGEELGLIGALALVLAFGLLAWRGLRAAKMAPDTFGQLLAVGITVMIVAQAFFNVSVALSLVPTKGIPLPFISCGGSSLAINLVAAGILMNVTKHSSRNRDAGNATSGGNGR